MKRAMNEYKVSCEGIAPESIEAKSAIGAAVKFAEIHDLEVRFGFLKFFVTVDGIVMCLRPTADGVGLNHVVGPVEEM